MQDIQHPGINELRIVDDMDGESLLRIDWDFDSESVLTAIIETEVELASAHVKAGRWRFDIRGDDQTEISEFHSYCQDNGITITFTEIHTLSPLHSEREYVLTEPQREALTLAYDRGNYESPREVT